MCVGHTPPGGGVGGGGECIRWWRLLLRRTVVGVLSVEVGGGEYMGLRVVVWVRVVARLSRCCLGVGEGVSVRG